MILWRHTWAGIRVEHGDALLAGGVLEEALLGAVIGRASQTGQIDQEGDRLVRGKSGQKEVEGHLGAGCSRIVAQLEQLAAERGDRSLGGDGHDGEIPKRREARADESSEKELERRNINRELTSDAGFCCPA